MRATPPTRWRRAGSTSSQMRSVPGGSGMAASSGPAIRRPPERSTTLDGDRQVLGERRLVGLELLDLVEQRYAARHELGRPTADDIWAIRQMREHETAVDDVGRSDRERRDEHVVFEELHVRRSTCAELVPGTGPNGPAHGESRPQRVGDQTGRVPRPAAEVERQTGRAWCGTFEEPARGGLEHARDQIEPISGGNGVAVGVARFGHGSNLAGAHDATIGRCETWCRCPRRSSISIWRDRSGSTRCASWPIGSDVPRRRR